MIIVRMDDVRNSMSNSEISAIELFAGDFPFQLYISYTPLWLRVRSLLDPREDYYQSSQIDAVSNQMGNVLKEIIESTNVSIGLHGLYHYYDIRSYRKLKHLFYKKTLNFDPEWKFVSQYFFERDYKIGAELIREKFGSTPDFISPPSNVISCSARRYCKLNNIPICSPNSNILNSLFVKLFWRTGRISPLARFNNGFYLPLYSDDTAQRFASMTNLHFDPSLRFVLLLHPWELKHDSYKQIKRRILNAAESS